MCLRSFMIILTLCNIETIVCSSSSSSSSSEDEESILSMLADLGADSTKDFEDILKANLEYKEILHKIEKDYYINKFQQELFDLDKGQEKYFEKILEHVKSIAKGK